MHSVDNSQSSSEYYYRLYWAHALIRHYLTTGRKYALIKKYALNKISRLLTRLYGSYQSIPLFVWNMEAFIPQGFVPLGFVVLV